MLQDLKFQGRGSLFLAQRDANGKPGPYKNEICTDSLAISFASDSFSHTNKCGPVDVEDFRGTKSQSAQIDISFASVADRNFAIAVLGTVVNAATGTVSGEVLPDNIVAGDVYFLGGATRHRGISALVLGSLVLNTDYTLEALSGRVTFLTDVGSPAPTAAYSFNDPESVAFFTAPQEEYFIMYEFINKANNNKPGSLELYRGRFDPLSNADFQSDELQIADLKGSVLADLTKLSTDALGQFGRRIL